MGIANQYRALAAVVVIAASFQLMATPATAVGEERGGGEAFGSIRGDLFAIDFRAVQHSADRFDASGYVRGSSDGTNAGPIRGLAQAGGEVVCVDIQGNRIGLLYKLGPRTQVAGVPFPAEARTVWGYGTAQDNGPGHKDLMGIVEGLAVSPILDCRPGLLEMRVTDGDLTIRPASSS